MAKATTMGPMKIKESASYRVFKVFNAIILTLISVAMLYPFLYLVAQSFSSTQAIVAGEVTHDNAQEKLDTFIGNVNAGGTLE